MLDWYLIREARREPMTDEVCYRIRRLHQSNVAEARRRLFTQHLWLVPLCQMHREGNDW